jgi:YfiH family protein
MNPPRQTSNLLGASHGFFGRAGGASKPPFDTLNAGLASGDDGHAVAENRRRITVAIGADTLLTARQVHSAKAYLVEEPFAYDDRPEADALVTTVPGLAVAVLTADCVPILLETEKVVAAVHAGWRGSLCGVIESAVALMEEQGAKRQAVRAVIGPSLRRESFEVRADLRDLVLASHPEAEAHFERFNDEQWLYDHTAFVQDRLMAAGLASENIDDVGGDTLAAKDRYFSYRAARRAGKERFGHNAAAIALSR